MKQLARALRRAAIPLAAYYCVTLALPVANGAALAGAAFVRHALVVIVIPPIIVALLAGLRGALNYLHSLPKRHRQEKRGVSECLHECRRRLPRSRQGQFGH